MNDTEKLIEKFKDGWGNGKSECGSASEGASGEVLFNAVKYLIAAYDIKSVSDVCCGDCYWMKHIFPDIEEYNGYDLIEWKSWEGLRKAYPDINLTSNFNAAIDIPQKADAIICCSAFPHLSNDMIVSMLEKFKASGATWLFAFPSHPEISNNASRRDVVSKIWNGGFNLALEPFSLGPPVEMLGSATPSKGIWKLN